MKLFLDVYQGDKIDTFVWEGEKAPTLAELKAYLMDIYAANAVFHLKITDINGIKGNYSSKDIIPLEMNGKRIAFKPSRYSIHNTFSAGEVDFEVYSMQNHNPKKAPINQDAVSLNTFTIPENVQAELKKLPIKEQMECVTTALKNTRTKLAAQVEKLSISQQSGAANSTVVCYRPYRLHEKDKKAPGLYAAIAQTGDTSVHEMTRDNSVRLTPYHDLNSPSELRRITEAKGVIDRQYVYAPDTNFGIAMTRSVGDTLLRKAGVISEPEMITCALHETSKLRVCSDGVTNHIERLRAEKQTTDMIMKQLNDPKLKKKLLNEAAIHDDATEVTVTNLAKMEVGKIYYVSLSDGHGQEGQNIAIYSLHNFEPDFVEQLTLQVAKYKVTAESGTKLPKIGITHEFSRENKKEAENADVKKENFSSVVPLPGIGKK